MAAARVLAKPCRNCSAVATGTVSSELITSTPATRIDDATAAAEMRAKTAAVSRTLTPAARARLFVKGDADQGVVVQCPEKKGRRGEKPHDHEVFVRDREDAAK